MVAAETAFFLNEANTAFEGTDFDGNRHPDRVGFDLITLLIYETPNSRG